MRTILMLAVVGLAACDGGGGDPVARPGDLRLSIIRGASQTGQVKPASPGALQVNAELLPDPVVVRISVVGGSASVGVVGTGPQLAAAIPPGAIVNWTVIGEAGCGSPFAAVTAVEGTDSVVNYWRRGTKAGVECKMVAEGVSGGQMFGSDTARAEFTAGAPSRIFDSSTSSIMPFPRPVAADAVTDTYGNSVPFRIVATGPIGVAGEALGTVEARTLTWVGPSTGGLQRTILPIMDAAGVQIGKLLVVASAETSGWYRAVGVDIPIS